MGIQYCHMKEQLLCSKVIENKTFLLSTRHRVSRIPGRFAKDRVNIQNTHANLPLVGNSCTNGAVGTKNWANSEIRGTGA